MPMHAHVREGKGVHAWSGEDVEAAKLQGEGVQNVIKLKKSFHMTNFRYSPLTPTAESLGDYYLLNNINLKIT